MERRDYTKVFDVSRPSKTAPDATSKPVIVGHHPMMADPMVRPAVHHTDPDVGMDKAPHHSKVVEVSDTARQHIALSQPPSPEQLAAEAAAEDKGPQTGTLLQPAQPTQTADTSPMPVPPVTPVNSAPAASLVTPTLAPAVNGQPAAPKATVTAAPEPDLSHIQHVPVSHMPATSSGRLKMMALWLIVAGFLVAFGLYLAIDAGFIQTNINLPFHIFSS
jgi:hypothetical protein